MERKTTREWLLSFRAGVARFVAWATLWLRARAAELEPVAAEVRHLALAWVADARRVGNALRRLAVILWRRGGIATADWRRQGLARFKRGARGAMGVLRRVALPLSRIRLRPGHLAILMLPLLIGPWLLYSNCGVGGCPDVTTLAAYQPGGASVLLDRNGEPFADLAPFERVVVPLDSLPAHVTAAFIAVEDRRFWEHRGIDWSRVFGAALVNIRARSVRQGSSTIPMQLARNLFPERLPATERTLRRKLQEMQVATRLERTFEKREILELYVNHIYFGGGAYGIEAASRLYFDKPASQLSVAEAATLAALPKAPTHYDPRRQPERSRARRDLVLTLMQQQRVLDADTADAARQSPLAVRADGARDRSGIPLGANFIDVVRDAMEDHFGADLYRQRLVVHTTLDPRAQRAAEKELEAQIVTLEGRVRAGAGPLQGAMVIMEAHSGDVLALVGGRDAATSRYNRAVSGRRQVGSAFKPFVFAAALDRGVPTSRMVLDAPLRMQLSRHDVWQPSNYDGRFDGPISLREALVRSRNVPTVRLANDVGMTNVARTAQASGIHDRMDVTPSLALGTVATSPLRMAAAYTTFATLGRTSEPRFVVRVEDEHGNVLWEPPESEHRQALDPGVAYIVTDILRDAVDFGTGTGVRHAGFRGAVAGKTGTTNNATDAWFVGYTPDVVATVWIGYDRPSPLGAAATGGGFAAPVWGRVMRQLYGAGGRAEPRDWQMPQGLAWHRIDPQSGLRLQTGCYTHGAAESSELFLAGNLPAMSCPRRDFWRDFWGTLRGRPVDVGGGPPRGGR
jgi:1A family penicillin-binding protein